MESKYGLKEEFMKATGMMTSDNEKAKKQHWKVIHMKENLQIIDFTALEF